MRIARNFKVSSDISVLKFADIVISTLPSNIFALHAHEYLRFVENGCYFGVMPGLGGKEFYVSSKVNFFSFQRVHGVSRIKEYGNSVYDLGKRELLHIAGRTKTDCIFLAGFFEKMLGIKCECVPNYLNITLTPSNPILHTSRLYSLGMKEVSGYLKKDYLFYEDWDDHASEILISMDEELQNICKELSPLDLSKVVSLRIHYESNTVKEMTEKIRSIKAFNGLKSPLLKSDSGYVFDRESRYFVEDFLFGLLIIYDFSKTLKVSTPTIDKVIKWYNTRFNEDIFDSNGQYNDLAIAGKPVPSQFGLDSKEKIISYYSK